MVKASRYTSHSYGKVLPHPSPTHSSPSPPKVLSCCPRSQPPWPEVCLRPKVLLLGAMPRSRSHCSVLLYLLLVLLPRYQLTRAEIGLLPKVLLRGAMPRSKSYGSVPLQLLLVRALNPTDEGLPAPQGPAAGSHAPLL